jgi:asparagine synthetase B (glutamine-hydrolysing)
MWSLNQYGDFDWVCQHFKVSPEELISHRVAALKPYRNLPDMDLITVMDFISDVAALQNVWSKIGERAGRIIHYPFCSQPIIDAASQLTWNEKLAKPKALLRDVAQRVGVPQFILDRRKSGFGVARRDWAVRDGLFQPLVDVAARVFPRADIERHQSTAIASRFTVWNIVNFAVWKRLVVDGEALNGLAEELDERIAEWEQRTAGRRPDGDNRP